MKSMGWSWVLAFGALWTALGCGNKDGGRAVDAAADAAGVSDGAAGAMPSDDGLSSAAGDAPPSAFTYECFEGTPRTHHELLNACWAATVIAVHKVTTLPGGHAAGSPLPPLP